MSFFQLEPRQVDQLVHGLAARYFHQILDGGWQLSGYLDGFRRERLAVVCITDLEDSEDTSPGVEGGSPFQDRHWRGSEILDRDLDGHRGGELRCEDGGLRGHTDLKTQTSLHFGGL